MENFGQKSFHLHTVKAEGADPTPPVKRPFFVTTSLWDTKEKTYLRGERQAPTACISHPGGAIYLLNDSQWFIYLIGAVCLYVTFLSNFFLVTIDDPA